MKLYNIYSKYKQILQKADRSKLKTFDVKVYHKSKKNRSQAVMKTLDGCNKIRYVSKRRKRTFYKKLDCCFQNKMSWFKNVFNSQSSQETKVVCKIPKKDKKDNEDPQISGLKIEEEKEGQEENAEESIQESWFSLWSGLSTTFDSPKSKKKEFSDDDEEENKWWSSFCSKQRNESKSEPFFSTQTSASSQSSQATNIPTQTSVNMDDNKKDDNDEDDSKVEFFLRVGKHKKFINEQLS